MNKNVPDSITLQFNNVSFVADDVKTINTLSERYGNSLVKIVFTVGYNTDNKKTIEKAFNDKNRDRIIESLLESYKNENSIKESFVSALKNVLSSYNSNVTIVEKYEGHKNEDTIRIDNLYIKNYNVTHHEENHDTYSVFDSGKSIWDEIEIELFDKTSY